MRGARYEVRGTRCEVRGARCEVRISSRTILVPRTSYLAPRTILSPLSSLLSPLSNLGQDLILAHLTIAYEFRIAKRAMQITSCKTDKHRSTTCVAALTLQRVKDIINLLHKWQDCPHSPVRWPYSTWESALRTIGQYSLP